MTTWLVRKTGSDSNGGTSASVRSTGTDGVTAGTNALTSVTSNWTAADIGHGIFIGTVNQWRLITNVTAVNTLIFSGATIAVGTGRTWTIGGSFLTIGKNLTGTNPDQATGDTTYIGAGVYREVISIGITSPTTETFIIGDVDGVRTGDPGEVQWTGYTTNDKTASSGTAPLTLVGRDFLTFRNISFVTGNSTCIYAAGTAGANSNTFTDCTFITGHQGGARLVDYLATVDVPLNLTLDRCIFVSPSSGQMTQYTLPTSTVADYDANVQIRNCLFIGANGPAVQIDGTGANSFKGGGVDVLNCTFIGTRGIRCNNAGLLSTGIPCTSYNNFFYTGGSAAMFAATSGQLVEDYNVIIAGTPRTTVSVGANSKDNIYAPLFHFGQERKYGARNRPFGMPSIGSPLLVFGGSSPQAVDNLNTPRVAAFAAAGAFERGNTFVKETGTVRTGSNALSITGPGYQDFELPVNASSTTITVYVRWDATYAGTKPIMQVLNGTECGVADATATAAGSSGAWEQLSLNFTPTAKGIVTIRLLSSDTNGGGKMFADDFAVA